MWSNKDGSKNILSYFSTVLKKRVTTEIKSSYTIYLKKTFVRLFKEKYLHFFREMSGAEQANGKIIPW